MECLRHGTVELVSTVNNTVKGAIHFLSCGCFGSAAELRDPDYDPNPPAEPHPADVARDERIAELEAQVATLTGPPAAEPETPLATPAAVAHAEEVGVDLTQVEGTGADGKIVKADVAAAADAVPPAEGSA